MRIIVTLLLCTVLHHLSLGQDLDEGKSLFTTMCTACHEAGSGRVIGPGLKGVTEKREREWLIKFVQNSTELILSGDPDAIAIFEEYNKVVMNTHDLSETQIDNIFAYIDDLNSQEKSSVQVELTSGKGIVVVDDFVKLNPVDRHTDRWMTVFVAFIMLITVFVLIYSYSVISKPR
ncbi:MAG: cytochrome c [Bacteroidia bacterium]|nr:cytochrome c [Bacteroidia bacterium]